jgi:Uma2 family endonuclease
MSAEQAARPLREYLTPEAYLEGERHSEVRHEYFEGGVHAMADASAEHEFIALNFAAALLAHLKGKPCRVFKDGMKLKLQAMGRDIFCYPDIMVACDPADNHRYYREKPRLLIEVLSEDENKDLIEKFFAYQRLPSLEEYVVASRPREAGGAHLPARRTVGAGRDAPGGGVHAALGGLDPEGRRPLRGLRTPLEGTAAGCLGRGCQPPLCRCGGLRRRSCTT